MTGCKMLSLFTTSPLAVCNNGSWTDLMESFQACSIESLIITFGPAGISRKLATGSKASNVTSVEILTRKVGSRKKTPHHRDHCQSLHENVRSSQRWYLTICVHSRFSLVHLVNFRPNKCGATPLHTGYKEWVALPYVRYSIVWCMIRWAEGYRPSYFCFKILVGIHVADALAKFVLHRVSWLNRWVRIGGVYQTWRRRC